jgi:hypothetical protein
MYDDEQIRNAQSRFLENHTAADLVHDAHPFFPEIGSENAFVFCSIARRRYDFRVIL